MEYVHYYFRGVEMKIQTSVRVEDSFYKEAKTVFTKFGHKI